MELTIGIYICDQPNHRYSDVWAYGIVCIELVTDGAQPYVGLSNDSVTIMVLSVLLFCYASYFCYSMVHYR